MELETISIQNEKKNCDQNSSFEANPSKGIDDLQEAAISLYEQYLSEKVWFITSEVISIRSFFF